MKRITLLLACAALLTTLTQSCKKVKDAVKANVDVYTTDFAFDIAPINNTNAGAAMGTFSTVVNVDSIIKAANSQLGAGNIASAKIDAMSITLINYDDTTNISNLLSCSAAFSSNGKPDAATVASVTNNPDVQGSSLSLNPNTSLELKDYFSSTTFNYVLTGQLRRPTGHILHATATIKFTLQVSL